MLLAFWPDRPSLSLVLGYLVPFDSVQKLGSLSNRVFQGRLRSLMQPRQAWASDAVSNLIAVSTFCPDYSSQSLCHCADNYYCCFGSSSCLFGRDLKHFKPLAQSRVFLLGKAACPLPPLTLGRLVSSLGQSESRSDQARYPTQTGPYAACSACESIIKASWPASTVSYRR